ncbi:YdcF family protein [Candidatus Uhrbacteria bacterium]|nr:YdcF family protein [Candidatus Uhrbacteria bacterium]
MRRAIVAMLCGPHDNTSREDGLSFRRIDKAINVAKQFQLPIIIAGDAFQGTDLRAFEDRACNNGVGCFRVYDAHANTLADVQGIIRFLRNDPEFQRGAYVHLVTDNWHMARAASMLMMEAQKKLDLHIRCENVFQDPLPPQEVLDGERQGLTDYLEGRYGQRALALSYGKPKPVIVVGCEGDTELVTDLSVV